jgi:hypothetical protein
MRGPKDSHLSHLTKRTKDLLAHSSQPRSLDHFNLHLSPPLSIVNKRGEKEERRLD